MESGLKHDRTEKEVFDILKEELVYDESSPTFLKWISGKKGRNKDLVCGGLHPTEDGNVYGVFCFEYKTYRIHRFIFYIFNDYLPEMVDHIDGCGTNNKPSNLRSACFKTNPMNLPKPRVNNTSGLRGVSFDKSRNKWRAYVTLEGKQFMKRFVSKNDAESFVIEKRRELFGEFCGDYINYDTKPPLFD